MLQPTVDSYISTPTPSPFHLWESPVSAGLPFVPSLQACCVEAIDKQVKLSNDKTLKEVFNRFLNGEEQPDGTFDHYGYPPFCDQGLNSPTRFIIAMLRKEVHLLKSFPVEEKKVFEGTFEEEKTENSKKLLRGVSHNLKDDEIWINLFWQSQEKAHAFINSWDKNKLSEIKIQLYYRINVFIAQYLSPAFLERGFILVEMLGHPVSQRMVQKLFGEALERGNYNTSIFLREKGADIRATDREGNTSLHFAIRGGNLELVKSLLEEEPQLLLQKNSSRKDLIVLAAKHGHLNIVKYFVGNEEESIDIGDLPLHSAVQNGHLDMVKYFIEETRILANTANSNGLTLLHEAAFKGHLDVVKYLTEYDKSLLRKKDGEQATPLHFAAEKGHIKILKYFAEKDPQALNMQNEDGKTPLNCLVDKIIFDRNIRAERKLEHPVMYEDLLNPTREAFVDIVTFLIERGANPYLRDEQGGNVIDYVIRNSVIPEEEREKLLKACERWREGG